MRIQIVLAAAAAAAVAAVASPAAKADVQCAYPVSMTSAGAVVTAAFDVVSPPCQVSMVGISYFGGPTTVVDTQSGTFDAGRYELSVTLPCGTHTEADLVVGPPLPLFPPPPYDLRDVEYLFACAAEGEVAGPSSTAPAQTCTPTPLGCYEQAPHEAYCTSAGAFEDLLLGQAAFDASTPRSRVPTRRRTSAASASPATPPASTTRARR